ncbi:C13 family peptidase [Microvirga roseola]|uniref:C13 family peptidase n=1 Tax=Microvirga roseola TaxID=2883126 RepID=UPI001E51EE56|nr:C13 family peptidase [Microvirga roseola]
MRRILSLCLLGIALSFGLPGDAVAQAAQRSGAFKLAPQRPGEVDVYILSFGLWGPESVFESEAKGAARILEAQIGSKGRTLVLFNGKRRFGAKPASIMAAAKAAGRALDPAEDVAVLVLTSHGTPEGIGVVAGKDEWLMTPEDVRTVLDETRARNRVVIVSACYSGIFAEKLADERTLVITAAAADKPSFGCEDGATWTYFGDAFFNKALPGKVRLDAAFEEARRLVTQREEREGFDPSNPQMAGGSEVLERVITACAAPPVRQACRCARPSAATAVC